MWKVIYHQFLKACLLILFLTFPNLISFIHESAISEQQHFFKDVYFSPLRIAALGLAGTTLINIFNVRLNNIGAMTFMLFPMVTAIAVSMDSVTIQINYQYFEKNAERLQWTNLIIFILNFFYFIVVHTKMALSSALDYHPLDLQQKSVIVPPVITRAFNLKSPKQKLIVFLVIRFVSYMFASILLSFLSSIFFGYEHNLPNLLGVFSAYWSVLTFVGELFIAQLRKINTGKE